MKMDSKEIHPFDAAQQSSFLKNINENTFENMDLSGSAVAKQLLNRETPLSCKGKPKRRILKAILFFLIYILSCLAQFPLILLTLISKMDVIARWWCLKNSQCCRRFTDNTQQTHFMARCQGVEIDEDYTEFWVAEDIQSEEDKVLYENILDDRMKCMHQNIIKLDKDLHKEMNEIIKRKYLVRLSVFMDLVEKYKGGIEESENFDMNLALAFLHGETDMASSLLNFAGVLDHPLVRVGIKDCMLDNISLLHMGILNCNFDLIQQLLSLFNPAENYEIVHKRCADVVHEATKSAELPLNLAVSLGSCQIVRFLIEHGAEMDEQDSQGFNCFHALVFLSQKAPDKVHSTFNTLLDCIPTWTKSSRKYPELTLMTATNAEKIAKWRLLKTMDKHKFTPLKLAASEGTPGLVEKFFAVDGVYHFPYRHLGPNSVSLYDVSEVDPYLTHWAFHTTRASVLELVALGSNKKHLHMLEVNPLTTISSVKIRKYDGIFRAWAIIHITSMMIISIYHMVLANNTLETTITDNQTVFYRRPAKNQHNLNAPDFCIILLVILYIYYAITLLITGFCVGIRCRKSHSWTFIFWGLSRVQCSTMLLFVIFGTAYMAMKLTHRDHHILLAMTVIVGWSHSLLFIRGLKQTAFFSVMLYQIASGDVTRYGMIILIAILMFAVATILVFAPETTTTDDVHLWHKTMLNYLKLSMGIGDFSILYNFQSEYEFVSKMIYISFLILLNLVVLNMLIATMTDTFSTVQTNRHLLCKKAQIGDCIFIEWLFPIFIQAMMCVPVRRRLIRVKLPDGSMWEQFVYLMEAPSPNYCLDSHSNPELKH